MKHNYIGTKPTQSWKNNSGVFSVNDHKNLREEDKIASTYGLEFISKTSFNNDTIEITFPQNYETFMLVINNMSCGGGIQVPSFRVKFEGESSFHTASQYKHMYRLYDDAGTAIDDGSRGQAYGEFGARTANTQPKSTQVVSWLMNFTTAGIPATMISQGHSTYVAGTHYGSHGGNQIENTANIVAMEINSNNGTSVISGDVILYGLKAPKLDNATIVGA